jgi:hypothetical protein
MVFIRAVLGTRQKPCVRTVRVVWNITVHDIMGLKREPMRREDARKHHIKVTVILTRQVRGMTTLQYTDFHMFTVQIMPVICLSRVTLASKIVRKF